MQKLIKYFYDDYGITGTALVVIVILGELLLLSTVFM